MKYDFITMLDRRGKDALAVEAIGLSVPWASAPSAPKEGYSPIPMWVADMNFATVPQIQDEISKRLSHPAFGYYMTSPAYYQAISHWHRDRKNVSGLTNIEIGYENGVLGCVASSLKAFTLPGEKILLHSPTYIGFTHTLEDTGRVAELSPLKRDENGIWRMDYEDMDRRLRENHIHLAIFCSPHNPCGRVWERWEIEKAMEIYRKNQCLVISDEIWSDILLNGHSHIPTQSVNEDAKNRTIAIYAPSKTFNLAGLIGSYHVIYNPYLRDQIQRVSASTHYNEMNVLSMHALIGAYSQEGRIWVDELCQVLSGNINAAMEIIDRDFPGVSAAKPEGTYMVFLHCEQFCKSKGITIDDLVQAGWDVGVAWQKGAPFHDPWGIRMNFAVPYAYVQEALRRLEKYVFIVS